MIKEGGENKLQKKGKHCQSQKVLLAPIDNKKSDKKKRDDMQSMIFGASNDVENWKRKRGKKAAEGNYEQETKMEIMSTLLHINGTMKEFAEDIEERMGKAFRSKAGKKYGVSEAEIELRRAKYEGLGFGRVQENMRDVNR